MRVGAVVLLAMLTGACQGAVPDNAPGNQPRAVAAAPAPAAAARPADNVAVARDCPDYARLYCGHQRPVVSDGRTAFRNPDMFLSAVFPAGSHVCMTRSGWTPRGFFAVYGAPPGCPERPERPPRFIVLNAIYNAAFDQRIEDAVQGCDPLSAETQRRLSGAPLAMSGFKTLVCETHGPAGAIEITLNFLGGPWQEGDTPRSRVRSIIYDFHLGTKPDHFDEDLARFRQVLASVRIATRD